MFHVRLQRNLAELPSLLGCLDDFAARQGWSDRLAGQVRLAVEELFVNFATHGVPQGTAPPWFEVVIESTTGGVECVVRDNAAPFDPRDRAAAGLHGRLASRPVGGLGLSLLGRLGVVFDYASSDGVNTTRLRLGGELNRSGSSMQ
jgi:anti-sigma regulatory factor (Ser/Thr protein kinase)